MDGAERSLEVDRRIAILLDGEDGPLMTVHTSGPERDFRGAYSYVHRRIELPADALPSQIVVNPDNATPVDDAVLMTALREVTLRQVDADVPYASQGWTAVRLPVTQQTAAIDAVVKEFAHLNEYWPGKNGATFPISSKLSAPRVDVVGEWPTTRVEVTFRHPGYAMGWVRRTVRVFDDAGRVTPPLYASIHLMEDVATRELPPAANAADGIVDF
jgi:hypothetical protein